MRWFLDKLLVRRVDSSKEMSQVLANRAVRLLLSVSVSIWMAGGCLFGCTSGATDAQISEETTVAEGASCHAMPPPECCKTPKPKKHTTSKLKLSEGLVYLVPAPRGMMKDCPLSVNATAATSKSSTYLPQPGRVPVAALPNFEKQSLHADVSQAVPFLHNRGSTHLRCCVFLI